MTDGTLETIDGRRVLRFVRTLPHSVERVWRAVSDPAELERWFPAAVEWTPTAGEELEAYGMTGEVTEADAPHRLAWTFNGDGYSFELAAHGEGYRLVFAHVFDDRTLAAQTAAGWQAYFLRLDAHLAGEHLSEEAAHESWGEIHERYAERFGADPEPGRAFWEQLRARWEGSRCRNSLIVRGIRGGVRAEPERRSLLGFRPTTSITVSIAS